VRRMVLWDATEECCYAMMDSQYLSCSDHTVCSNKQFSCQNFLARGGGGGGPRTNDASSEAATASSIKSLWYGI
jgi:hypothetical protein